MSVQADDSVKTYPGNGAAVLFDGPRLFDAATLSVTLVDTVTQAVTSPAYSVTRVGANGPSAVLLTVAPPVGATLILRRTLLLEQSADFTNQQTLLRRVIEATFDVVVMMIQQLGEMGSRSLRIGENVVGVNPVLPPPQALRPLVWNVAGNAFENGDPGVYGDMLLRGNLAAAGGSNLVGFLQAGVGSRVRSVQDKAFDSVSVLDFMTTAERADVRAGTALLDVTASVQAVLDAQQNIHFPTGGYRIGVLTVNNDKVLTGNGWGTKIFAADTGNTLNVVGSNVEISGFQFASRNGALFPALGAFRTSGAYIRAFGNRVRVRNCFMGLGFVGIENIGTSNTFEGVDVRDTRPTTGIAFNVLGGFDVSFDHCLTDNPVGSQPLAAMQIKSAGDLTISDCGFIRSGTDLLCNGGTGDTLASLMVVNTYFDTAVRGVAFVPTAGCAIVRSAFINCWFSSQTGVAGIQLDSSGGGTIQGVTLVNPQVFLNSGDGIRLTGANTTDVDIIGGQGAGNSVALQVGNSVQRWRVRGFVAGPVYGESANGYGAFIGTGCTNYAIQDCTFAGNTTAQVSNGSESAATARISGNVGYDAPIQNVTFQNSWVNLGPPTEEVNYFKDADGMVTIRGLATAGTIGQTIFTLPAGFRPRLNESFAVNSNGAFGSCQVTSAGAVNALAGSNAWFSLSGIRFRAG